MRPAILRAAFSEDEERQLELDDLHKARIPEHYAPCRLSLIPDSAAYKAPLAAYIKDLVQRVKTGSNIVFHGPHGSGKTTAAIILLKGTMSFNGQTLMVLADEVCDLIRSRAIFNEENRVTFQRQMQDVDLLLIDDLNFKRLRPWEKDAIETLVRRRAGEGLTTFITTNHKREFFKETFKAGMVHLGRNCEFIRVICDTWSKNEADPV